MHTSAKARLTSVAIRIRNPDRHQNLIIVHWPIASIPWKFYANPFRSSCAKLLMDKQTTTITYPPWRRQWPDLTVWLIRRFRRPAGKEIGSVPLGILALRTRLISVGILLKVRCKLKRRRNRDVGTTSPIRRRFDVMSRYVTVNSTSIRLADALPYIATLALT